MSKSLKYLIPTIGGVAVLGAVAATFADFNITRIDKAGAGLPIPADLVAERAAADTADETTEPSTEAAAAEPALSRKGGFGLGREATSEEVSAWDIDVRPDGTGLPEGSGDVWTGEEVWVENCAVCHGDFGEAVGRWPVIAGGWDTLDRRDPVKTVGSYWPYLSTVYDYIHRAMPFGNAQSLDPDQVYALTAYILYLNNIVEDDFELSKETFSEVKMPNADGFFMDDRSETELSQWREKPCMESCKDNVEITMRARVLDVTPGSDEEAVDAAADAPAEAISATDMATEGNATDLEVAEAEGVDGAQGSEPEEVAALDPDLVSEGEGVFRQCQACHAVGDGAKNKVGPQLNDVVGRTMGDAEGYRYSKALTEANEEGRVWTEENLAAFLEDPRGYLSGNKMSFRGLSDSQDREAVIAYLKSHGS